MQSISFFPSCLVFAVPFKIVNYPHPPHTSAPLYVARLRLHLSLPRPSGLTPPSPPFLCAHTRYDTMRESDRKSGLQYHFNVTEFGAYAIEFYFAQINGGDEAKFSVYVSKRCIFLSLSSR